MKGNEKHREPGNMYWHVYCRHEITQSKHGGVSLSQGTPGPSRARSNCRRRIFLVALESPAYQRGRGEVGARRSRVGLQRRAHGGGLLALQLNSFRTALEFSGDAVTYRLDRRKGIRRNGRSDQGVTGASRLCSSIRLFGFFLKGNYEDERHS
jgi:hypothetical protein